MSKKIKKILIANRGEIAIRIIQTCREMGIETVTIFTDEESEFPHALESDQQFCLGSGPLSETYLNQEKLISICKELNIDAIHPGYGFLSENSTFSSLVRKNGIIFIGPSEESIILMGDKKDSKVHMESLGIPLIPGYHGNDQSSDLLKAEAKKIGYPILIKATAGGGGKGMRVVRKESDFVEELEGAKREAKNAFGNDLVLIEKYITNPRHIEVQVFSDRHGNHIHLFERECSIQRRHQKIVEESPSPSVDSKLRERITEVAVKICEGINYEGAGTIEYILDDDGSFYFLEMNTRLQVEHPVTEYVTGLDLVRMQILVAEGKELEVKQEEITQTGHSIEVRIYAEDPDNGFLPATGKIEYVGTTNLRDIRLETGYAANNSVTVSFDPMLAKLVVLGKNRGDAITKMKLALGDVPFLGIKTNRDYLKRILEHPEYLKGLTYTHFVETHSETLLPKAFNDEEMALGLASFLFSQKGKSSNKVNKRSETYNVWENLGGFRL